MTGPPPRPADPSAPPDDAGLDADDPMTWADPDPPSSLHHEALTALMRGPSGFHRLLQLPQPADPFALPAAGMDADAPMQNEAELDPSWDQQSVGCSASALTHPLGEEMHTAAAAGDLPREKAAAAVAAAPPPPPSATPTPLFHSGWDDGARHQVLECLWYLLLRIGLVDGDVVLQSVLRSDMLPDRKSQLQALAQCMAAVFNAATGSRSEGDQHYRYYKRLAAGSAEGPSMLTTKKQRRWTLQPWEMSKSHNAVSALLLQALEAARGGDLKAGLVDQLQGVVPKLEELVAEEPVQPVPLGDATPEERLSTLKEAFSSGKLSSCSGVDCAQHWYTPHQAFSGEERPTVIEYRSTATRHEACRLRVLLSTETLQVCIMAWGAPVPEPAWLSHAARGRVTCLDDLSALLSDLHTAGLCTGLTHPSHKATLAEMSQANELPEGIQHVEDRGGVDMFLDAGYTVLSW